MPCRARSLKGEEFVGEIQVIEIKLFIHLIGPQVLQLRCSDVNPWSGFPEAKRTTSLRQADSLIQNPEFNGDPADLGINRVKAETDRPSLRASIE